MSAAESAATSAVDHGADIADVARTLAGLNRPSVRPHDDVDVGGMAVAERRAQGLYNWLDEDSSDSESGLDALRRSRARVLLDAADGSGSSSSRNSSPRSHTPNPPHSPKHDTRMSPQSLTTQSNRRSPSPPLEHRWHYRGSGGHRNRNSNGQFYADSTGELQPAHSAHGRSESGFGYSSFAGHRSRTFDSTAASAVPHPGPRIGFLQVARPGKSFSRPEHPRGDVGSERRASPEPLGPPEQDGGASQADGAQPLSTPKTWAGQPGKGRDDSVASRRDHKHHALGRFTGRYQTPSMINASDIINRFDSPFQGAWDPPVPLLDSPLLHPSAPPPSGSHGGGQSRQHDAHRQHGMRPMSASPMDRSPSPDPLPASKQARWGSPPPERTSLSQWGPPEGGGGAGGGRRSWLTAYSASAGRRVRGDVEARRGLERLLLEERDPDSLDVPEQAPADEEVRDRRQSPLYPPLRTPRAERARPTPPSQRFGGWRMSPPSRVAAGSEEVIEILSGGEDENEDEDHESGGQGGAWRERGEQRMYSFARPRQAPDTQRGGSGGRASPALADMGPPGGRGPGSVWARIDKDDSSDSSEGAHGAGFASSTTASAPESKRGQKRRLAPSPESDRSQQKRDKEAAAAMAQQESQARVAEAVASALKDAGPESAFECHICFEVMALSATLACGHSFCWACIHQWCQDGKSATMDCPTCGVAVPRGDLRRCVMLDQFIDAEALRLGYGGAAWQARLAKGRSIAANAEGDRRQSQEKKRKREDEEEKARQQQLQASQGNLAGGMGMWAATNPGMPPGFAAMQHMFGVDHSAWSDHRGQGLGRARDPQTLQDVLQQMEEQRAQSRAWRAAAQGQNAASRFAPPPPWTSLTSRAAAVRDRVADAEAGGATGGSAGGSGNSSFMRASLGRGGSAASARVAALEAAKAVRDMDRQRRAEARAERPQQPGQPDLPAGGDRLGAGRLMRPPRLRDRRHLRPGAAAAPADDGAGQAIAANPRSSGTESGDGSSASNSGESSPVPRMSLRPKRPRIMPEYAT